MAGDQGLFETDLTDEQLWAMQVTIAVLGTVSTLLGLFVVLTYTCFPEKRKSRTSVLIYFFATVGTLLTAALMIPGYFAEALRDGEHMGLCYFQAGSFLFFGMCLQLSWFFITLNLFLRVHLDREEVPTWIPFSVSFFVATVVTVIPFALGGVTNDGGVWCFISSSNIPLIFGCFYGEMVLLTLVGTPLWIIIIWKMANSLMATWQSSKAAINESRHLLSVDNTPVTVGQQEKLLLLVRQTTFVTGFLIIFYLMVANRLIITQTGNTFAGWMVHAIALSTVGAQCFLVFGLSQRNVQLWRNKFSRNN